MSLTRSRAALALVALAVGPPAVQAGPSGVAVRLAGFESDQTRAVHFAVDAPIHARLVGIGAGSRGSLHAYGWLRRLDDGSLTWSMMDAEGNDRPGGREIRFDDNVDLPAGSYALGYFAGQRFRGAGMLPFLQHSKSPVERSSAWGLSLLVADDDLGHVRILPPEDPAEDDRIRLAPLNDGALARRRFRLTGPAEVTIEACGEGKRDLADRSWLLEVGSRKVVWELRYESTEEAGGASKNRYERRTLHLDAGAYELVAATDDSHSPERWNSVPPRTPEDWGVTLRAPHGTLASEGLPEERTIVRLAGASDEERLAATFRLERPARLRVYAQGEWSGGAGQLADRGWIEDATSGAEVWALSWDASRPGGGASKNRAVDETVELPAGSYRVLYTTDDSHAFGSWNASPPDDPNGWGIQVSTFDPRAAFEVTAWEVPTGGETRGRGFGKKHKLDDDDDDDNDEGDDEDAKPGRPGFPGKPGPPPGVPPPPRRR